MFHRILSSLSPLILRGVLGLGTSWHTAEAWAEIVSPWNFKISGGIWTRAVTFSNTEYCQAETVIRWGRWNSSKRPELAGFQLPNSFDIVFELLLPNSAYIQTGYLVSSPKLCPQNLRDCLQSFCSSVWHISEYFVDSCPKLKLIQSSVSVYFLLLCLKRLTELIGKSCVLVCKIHN